MLLCFGSAAKESKTPWNMGSIAQLRNYLQRSRRLTIESMTKRARPGRIRRNDADLEPILKSFVVLTVLNLVACLAWSQSPPAKEEENGTTIRSISALVTVSVMVRNSSGDLITNLAAGDFRLTDNGVEQKVLAEAAQGGPIALVVVMQTGGSAPAQFQNYRTLNAMVNFIASSSLNKVALVTFDSHLQEIWSFPPKVDGLKDAFRNPSVGDHGAAILDAVNCGIGLLEHLPANLRRVILLLSQASDDGSKASPQQVLQRIGESNVAIYSVTFSPGKSEPERRLKKEPHHGDTLLSAGPLDDALAAMRTNAAAETADLSGGENAQLRNKDSLERTLSVLANDFANSYMLSFRPNSEEPGLHWIKVQIMKKRIPSVEARTLYWKSEAGAED
jgi:VWFA-related protein